MPANQFQTFATSDGAYVQNPTTWAANGVRALGYPPGILPKEFLNTPVRQATSMAAAVATFIAANQSGDVNDDGNIAGLAAQLRTALDDLYAHPVASTPPVFGQVLNNTIPGVTTLTLNLTLTTGTWQVNATSSVYTIQYFADNLSINGTSVCSSPNLGDQAGTDYATLAGGTSVVVTGSSAVIPIVYTQEAGGNTTPHFIVAQAFRTA